MQQTKDISTFFKRVEDRWVFTGKHLEIWIPAIYQDRGLLTLGEIAKTLGIFQLRFNHQVVADFLLLAEIEIEFTNDRKEEEDGTSYIVLELKTGQSFIRRAILVKDSNVIYDIFVTMLGLGHLPKFLNYQSVHQLFDNDKRVCGINLGVNHSVWEMIYSHIFRDSKDPYKHYRHTSMTNPPQIVSLNQISHGPTSTTSKIVGSYMNEGIISSLVDDNQGDPSLIENLLRG